MPTKVEMLLEAERRGILPPDKKALLDEARNRGLVPSYDFDAGAMVKNIPGSAKNYASDMWNAVTHPVQTAKAVGNLGLGVAQKAIPGEQSKEVYADQVGQFIKDRYGSIDAAKQTLQNDPIGALVDFAGVITGAGGAIQAAGKVGVKGAAKAGNVVSRAGAALDPLNMAVNPVAGAVGKIIPEKTPANLYKRSAKWSNRADLDRDSITETALKHQLLPNESGVGKALMLSNNFGDYVDGLIDEINKSGGKIPASVVLEELGELKKSVGGFKFDAPSDLKKMQSKIDEFVDYVEQNNLTEVTPLDLQDFKQSGNSRNNYNATRGKGSQALEKTRKFTTRNAKEALEKIDDELRANGTLDLDKYNISLKEANQEWGKVLELMPELEKAAGRIENHNIVSLDTGAKVLAGTGIAGTPGAVAGGAISFLGKPRVRARIALYAHKLKKQGISQNMIDNNYMPAFVRQMLFEAGKLERAQESASVEKKAKREVNQ